MNNLSAADEALPVRWQSSSAPHRGAHLCDRDGPWPGG